MVAPVGLIFGCVERLSSHTSRFLGWGAMTPVIFITIGFLSCWFLLYALMEWTQDPQRKPRVTRGVDKEISHRERWNQRVVNFRGKERP
jgi:hypothetical protein